MVKDYVLHGDLHFITDDMVIKDARYVYFIRLTETGLPPFERQEDANAELPDYFLVGSLSGKFLSSVDNLLREVSWFYCTTLAYKRTNFQVYMPAIKEQFTEPVPAKTKTSAKKQEQANAVRRRSSDLSSLKRPSDYRRIAIKIQKEKQKAAQRFLLNEDEEESVVSEDIASEEDLASINPIKYELMQDVETVIDTVEW